MSSMAKKGLYGNSHMEGEVLFTHAAEEEAAKSNHRGGEFKIYVKEN